MARQNHNNNQYIHYIAQTHSIDSVTLFSLNKHIKYTYIKWIVVPALFFRSHEFSIPDPEVSLKRWLRELWVRQEQMKSESRTESKSM